MKLISLIILTIEFCLGREGDSLVGHPPYYARVISFFVVLFPAVDVASAYPLNAYTLGNALNIAQYMRFWRGWNKFRDINLKHCKGNNMMSYYYGDKMSHFEKSRFHLGLFRFIAAAPPIVAAGLISDLGSITDYTGLSLYY